MNKMIKNTAIFTIGVVGGFGLSNVMLIRTMKSLVVELSNDSNRQFSQHKYYKSNVDKYYDDMIFDSRTEAYEVLRQMDEIIHVYGYVTVADLYKLGGKHSCKYTHQQLCWNNLNSASVCRVREGYTLKLPKPFKRE